MQTPHGLEGAAMIGPVYLGDALQGRMAWVKDGKVYTSDLDGLDVILHKLSLDPVTLAVAASNGVVVTPPDRLPPGIILSDGRTVVHWDGRRELRLITGG